VPGTGLVQRGPGSAGSGGHAPACQVYQARRPVLRFHKGALANGSGSEGAQPYRADVRRRPV